MTLETWLAFFVASWAISLSPGAGAVSSMSAGLRLGLARGCWTVIGLQFGVLLHLAVVAAGVGALLAASQTAFEIIRWGGVAYLCWLGVQQWRAAPGEARLESGAGDSPREQMLRGLLVNASNPKAIVFMLAVLPQFLDASRPLAAQYGVMALTLCAVDMLVMAGYAGFASRVLRLLRSPGQQRLIGRVFGALFIGAALVLAAFRR